MTDRELIQIALDALAQSWVNDWHGNRKQVLAMCADDFEKPFEAMLALRKRLAQCDRCGKANPAEIHTCTPKQQEPGAVDSDKVICPSCCHQFRAIPVNVQQLMLAAGFEPPFTSPPQREWVGLTKEELAEISEFHFHGAFSGREVYEDIETRLKEKNT